MDLVTQMFSVFTVVSSWLIDTLTDVQSLFWTLTEGTVQITWLGTVSLVSMGVGLSLLVLGVITNFVKQRS